MGKTLLEIRNDFNERLNELFDLCNGRWVVLWGYGVSGRFLYHVFRRHGKQIDIRMDADESITGVARPEILASLDPETHMVILTFSPDANAIGKLEKYGFRHGESYIAAKEVFFGNDQEPGFLGYHEWIEHESGLDVWHAIMDLNAEHKDFNYYSKTPGYALIKALDTFQFHEGDRIFDYGCGKGSALALFAWKNVRGGGG